MRLEIAWAHRRVGVGQPGVDGEAVCPRRLGEHEVLHDLMHE
ncbi:hypothetical protein QSJ19_18725 [Gordonia sp. ABSL11-1]|nr:hypothetical protein [Gordonia sp. ABSL11-1]MDL9947579.1 hypothetical protein [Gordonia sp. ABSL11-1]